MTLARYKKLDGHPAWLYTVEMLVVVNGKVVKIAEFNCANDRELKLATECCDYVLNGQEIDELT
jgi:hypothetical protein